MAEEHTGGMIALVPDHPEQFAVPGGDPAEEMHATLAYLGDDVAAWPEALTEGMKAAVAAMATDMYQADAVVFAHAVWNPNSEEFEPATVYELADNGLLCSYADRAQDAGRRVIGALMPDQFVPFKPHITAGYNMEPGVLSYAGPVTFSTLRLALGGEVFDYPLASMGGEEAVRYAEKGTVQMAEKQPAGEVEIPDEEIELSGDAEEIPVTFPVIIVEGMETDDGRFIEPGALTHRALPLSILAQTSNPVGGEGHDGAEIIGRLTSLERQPGPDAINKETGEPFPEGTFVWSGKGVLDASAHGTKLAQKGYLTGNSADLSAVEAEFVWGEGADGNPGEGPKQIRMKSGKISATTLVSIPAFAQSYIVIDGQEIMPNEETITASAATAWRSSEIGDDCMLCTAGVEVEADHAPTTDGALMASGAASVREIFRPLDWFTDPHLDGPTPLTVDDDGRVYGHIALWGTCHIGFAGQCITPPHSPSDYQYFRTGAVRVVDIEGGRVPRDVSVGHITLRTGHADTSLAARPAAEHYDNTGTTAADVSIGDDAYGVWVAGSVRRGLAPEIVEELRASPISGDWRSINGALELVAALAVNVPGFPVPRARVASGAPVALLAAGVVPPGTDAEREERRQKALHDLGLTAEQRAAAALRSLFADQTEMLRWELEFGPSEEEIEFAKRKNWVEKAGGLPPYIKRIAKHLQEKGMDESRAIATAVNAAKKMCSTGDVNFPGKQEVNPGSKAEACAAVASWEKKKAAS